MELAGKSKINVIDRTIRKRKISSLLSNKKNIIGTFPVVVHSKKEIFSVVTIDIVLPVYNMMNGRTGDTQEAFIKQNAKSIFYNYDPPQSALSRIRSWGIKFILKNKSKYHSLRSPAQKTIKYRLTNLIIRIKIKLIITVKLLIKNNL